MVTFELVKTAYVWPMAVAGMVVVIFPFAKVAGTEVRDRPLRKVTNSGPEVEAAGALNSKEIPGAVGRP